MRENLEELHKLLGAVCGDICLALTLKKVTGGRATLKKWLETTRRAVSILERMVGD